MNEEKIKDALSIFMSFLAIAEAMDEQGEFEKPLTDFSVISHLSFGGGSITLDISHFRKLREALTT